MKMRTFNQWFQLMCNSSNNGNNVTGDVTNEVDGASALPSTTSASFLPSCPNPNSKSNPSSSGRGEEIPTNGGDPIQGSEEDDDSRGNWGSQFEFLLSCLSFAVGLGNIWRFPYLCYRNGGGAFLIPYTLNIFLTGIPLFFFELSLGQFGSRSPVAIWNVIPLFQGIGWAMFFISVGIGLYYNVIIAWTLYYFAATLGSLFVDHLPWTTCNNEWNTNDCVELHDIKKNGTSTENNTFNSAAEEYFSLNMLEISSGIEEPGSLRWQLVLSLVAAWSIVFVALLKGVKSFGKAVYFTALFPYLILTILLIRGLSLNGAIDGIRFYIKPDWTRLTDVQVWSDAAIQIFFSLGPCWGGLITLASYNKFTNNCFRDAIVIACANCATSLFAGFVVFSFVGFMAYELDKDIGDVVAKGPGLAFIVYPEAVSLLPGSKIWAMLFFTMLLALGLGTQFSILETIVSIICDSWPKRWGRANHLMVLCGACVTMFIGGLSMVTNGGMYVLQLMDNHAGTFSALITGCTEVLVLSWIYGVDRFLVDIQTMFQWSTNKLAYRIFKITWIVMWKFLTPFLCVLILIATWLEYKPMTYDDYVYPNWANGIGWIVSFTSVVCMPVGIAYKISNTPGSLRERIRKLCSPTVEWGPGKLSNRILAQKSWEENGFESPYNVLSGKSRVETFSMDAGGKLEEEKLV